MVPASPRIGGAFGAPAAPRFGGGGGPPGGGYGASRGGYGGGRGRGGPDDRMIGQVTTISKGPFRCAAFLQSKKERRDIALPGYRVRDITCI